MNCPGCRKEIVADRLFCNWCEVFIPNTHVGKKSGLFRRWLATSIDPAIGIAIFLVLQGIFGGIGSAFGEGGALAAIFIAVIPYGGFYFWLLSKGMTPGKWILREKVVEKLSGNYPGFWRMVLREVIGKFVSSLIFGLGFLWAIWDKDHQAWHDKIAGTVVVKRIN